MKMKVGLSVKGGDVTGKIGNFHLFSELLVHILFGRRVEESKGHLNYGPDSGYASGLHVIFLAELSERLSDFLVIVYAYDIFPTCFNVFIPKD